MPVRDLVQVRPPVPEVAAALDEVADVGVLLRIEPLAHPLADPVALAVELHVLERRKRLEQQPGPLAGEPEPLGEVVRARGVTEERLVNPSRCAVMIERAVGMENIASATGVGPRLSHRARYSGGPSGLSVGLMRGPGAAERRGAAHRMRSLSPGGVDR